MKGRGRGKGMREGGDGKGGEDKKGGEGREGKEWRKRREEEREGEGHANPSLLPVPLPSWTVYTLHHSIILSSRHEAELTRVPVFLAARHR